MNQKVDIKTGLPKKQVLRQQMEAKIQEGIQVRNSLASEQGKSFLTYLEQTLFSRLKTLMEHDQYCQGLLKVISSLNVDLKIIEKLSDDLFSFIDKPKQ
jgi:hypothetical protein